MRAMVTASDWLPPRTKNWVSSCPTAKPTWPPEPRANTSTAPTAGRVSYPNSSQLRAQYGSRPSAPSKGSSGNPTPMQVSTKSPHQGYFDGSPSERPSRFNQSIHLRSRASWRPIANLASVIQGAYRGDKCRAAPALFCGLCRVVGSLYSEPVKFAVDRIVALETLCVPIAEWFALWPRRDVAT